MSGGPSLLLRDLWRFRGGRLLLSAAVQFIASTLEGVGLALLIPLFSSIVSRSPSSASLTYRFILQFVNRFSGANPVYVLAAFAVLAFVGAAVATIVQSRIFHSLLFEFELDLRERFLDRYLHANWRMVATQDSGRIASFVNTQVRLVSESAYYFNYLLNSLLTIAVLTSIALVISPLLTLIMSTGFLVMIAAARRRIGMSAEHGTEIVDATQSIASRLQEILLNVKVIKAASLERETQVEFRTEAKRLASAQTSAKVSEDVTRALMLPSMLTSLLGVLLLGLIVLRVDVGRLLVFVGIGYRLLPPLSYIGSQYQKVMLGIPALRALHEKLDDIHAAITVRSGRQLADPLKPITIDLVHVSCEYELDKPVLRDVSLTVGAGEHICLQGPSGSGKSTLIDMVLGLIEPRSGWIAVQGVPLCEFDLQSWHSAVGYMGQETILWNTTIYKNLCWGVRRQVHEAEVIEWMERAGLRPLLERAAHGIHTTVGERGSLLSGGERQRLGLVRVLLKRPRFLLLDEVTSALDDENDARVLRLISSLEGMTILSIAHRPSWSRAARRTYVLERGRLVEREGVGTALRSRP